MNMKIDTRKIIPTIKQWIIVHPYTIICNCLVAVMFIGFLWVGSNILTILSLANPNQSDGFIYGVSASFVMVAGGFLSYVFLNVIHNSKLYELEKQTWFTSSTETGNKEAKE